MQFSLDKNKKATLFAQAHEQLVAALHTGKVRPGDRLPSVRQLAQRNGINIKTALAIYHLLSEVGYIKLRTGSGAYVSHFERSGLEPDYCLSVFNFIKSNLAEARRLKLDEDQYAALVQRFITRSALASSSIAVIECNEEQIALFAGEISARLNVRVFPILLKQLEEPDGQTVKALLQMSYFATTDFHFEQVKELTAPYKKKLLQLRLNPNYVPSIVEAARRGPLLMIVSNTSYFAAFCRSLLRIGVPQQIVERITAVDDRSTARVRKAIGRAETVYVSPVCQARIAQLIPENVKQLRIDAILSEESLEILEAVLLFYAQ